MAASELNATITEVQLQARKNNLLVNYGRSLFNDESQVTKPLFPELKSIFNQKIELVAPPHIFGDAIASDAVTSVLRTYFPWQALRALSQAEITSAATALGYIVYYGSESPYANFSLEDDQFGLLYCEKQLKTNFSATTSLWQKLALRLHPNHKAEIVSRFSGILFEVKDVYIPELKLQLNSGDNIPITIAGLNSIYSVGDARTQMVEQIATFLQLSLPPIHLPEPLVYIPLTNLVPSEDHYYYLKSSMYWYKVDGMYFLESELPEHLKPPAHLKQSSV